MADQRISELAALAAPDLADLLAAVDVDDTSMAASGTDKKLTLADLADLVTAEVAADLATHVADAAVHSTGQSLAVVDSGGALLFAPTGQGPHDVTGYKTATITVPDSGRIEVRGYTGNLTCSAVPASAPIRSAVALLVYEAAVVGGVEQAFGVGPVASAQYTVTVAGTGGSVAAFRPLVRTPGDQFVYKLAIYRVSGTGNPGISDVGALFFTYLDVLAR